MFLGLETSRIRDFFLLFILSTICACTYPQHNEPGFRIIFESKYYCLLKEVCKRSCIRAAVGGLGIPFSVILIYLNSLLNSQSNYTSILPQIIHKPQWKFLLSINSLNRQETDNSNGVCLLHAPIDVGEHIHLSMFMCVAHLRLEMGE